MTTRHYSLIKGFALATLMPLFAACSSEDDNPVQGGEPQEVQVSIGTRATADGDTWTWENNDVIGLNVTGYNGTSSSYTLTYNAQTGSWTRSEAIIVTLPGTITAWYPGDNVTTTATSFNIPGDQSTDAKLCDADYLTYSGALNNTTPSVALVHRLCKVAVTISGYEDYSGTPAVESEVFNSYLTVNYNNDAWTGTGELTSITPFKTESSADGHLPSHRCPGIVLFTLYDLEGKWERPDGELQPGSGQRKRLYLQPNGKEFGRDYPLRRYIGLRVGTGGGEGSE